MHPDEAIGRKVRISVYVQIYKSQIYIFLFSSICLHFLYLYFSAPTRFSFQEQAVC